MYVYDTKRIIKVMLHYKNITWNKVKNNSVLLTVVRIPSIY